ncbi:MAG: site-specific DNA-methyltransferase [Ardenticatenales bacterium]|nr:site-specific DNA-methyltransferase [Ardenticatenales bacterium]
MAPKPKQPKAVETLKHGDARRPNIPTAEYEAVMGDEEKSPIAVAYERRNRDLDPQLVWRGKDEQDWSDLVVAAPPLYIQEKVHPKVLIDDLLRQSSERSQASAPQQLNLFGDFNGLPSGVDATEFYKHEANWTNRMILGDSLQVMASLVEREGLRGKVQCIYLDPPYGIKFNSNFQWSTTSRDVKDGSRDHITREPEQVKAFRDTWRDGIHSYLTYLRDRLTVARDLLTESGSIFVQIGDENVHLLRSVMDEIFGDENFVSLITVRKTTSEGSRIIGSTCDFILWFSKNKDRTKARTLYSGRSDEAEGRYTSEYFTGSYFRLDNITSSRPAGAGDVTKFNWFGQTFDPGKGTFKTTEGGLIRLAKADRFQVTRNGKLNYRRFQNDFGFAPISNLWADISGAVQSRSDPKIYVVQTSTSIIARCILMATDPGDLVLDPTCGSGTTAYVAEQWGRRWITIDTSRVALALARARIMGALYPYYLLKDSKAGQRREAEITRTAPSSAPTYNNIRHGFVYERVPHITLKSIANNAEIDVIWERAQETLEPLRQQLNAALGNAWEEWEIPREPADSWPAAAQRLHADWWQARIARQRAIDASINARAEQEFLYDKPYEEKSTVRVAGPFTVESLSPHRILVVDENDELQQPGAFVADGKSGYGEEYDFTAAILENLRAAGVQQAHKEDRITFSALTGWPGHYLCAEGRYLEGENNKERRAGIFIGPEFGTVSRPDLVAAAREAADANFDVLIACAFNYDAHSAEFEKLGRVPVLKARMNADLHMADTLKSTGAGNLFVIFGEPDIDITHLDDNQIQVQLHGVDVFHPQSGEVRSSGPDGIACWFIDSNYNEESFFVRHAYFLGANDPYKSLKTTLKAEIDEDAWESLHSATSRPFAKPDTGRIAVKVINHLGDEVMKVFRVS